MGDSASTNTENELSQVTRVDLRKRTSDLSLFAEVHPHLFYYFSIL